MAYQPPPHGLSEVQPWRLTGVERRCPSPSEAACGPCRKLRGRPYESRASSRSMNAAWAGLSFVRAVCGSNQAHRSIAGNLSQRREPRGHSARIRLLVREAGAAPPLPRPGMDEFVRLLAHTAQGEERACGGIPVSSSNSRHAASGASSACTKPLGRVQAPHRGAPRRGRPGAPERLPAHR
jgi:hypothetical protein